MDTKISTYIGEFIATRQIEGLSAKTIAWYRWLLGKFVAGVGDVGLGELTITQAREFVASLQTAPPAMKCTLKDRPVQGCGRI